MKTLWYQFGTNVRFTDYFELREKKDGQETELVLGVAGWVSLQEGTG